MVKLSHSVFALPFALSGVTLAAADHGVTGAAGRSGSSSRCSPRATRRWASTAWPTTRTTRAIPAPRDASCRGAPVARRRVGVHGALAVAVRRRGVPARPAEPALLSPIALAIVFGYSYTKRFTWASHLVLGLALAMAPVGGWLAVRGQLRDAVRGCLPRPCCSGSPASTSSTRARTWISTGRRGSTRSPRASGSAERSCLARLLHAAAFAALVAVGLRRRPPPRLLGRPPRDRRHPRLGASPRPRRRPVEARCRVLQHERRRQHRLPRRRASRPCCCPGGSR